MAEQNGRPSGYSDAIADEICERISNGESLRSICLDDGMPSKSMVFRWLADEKYSRFRDQYAYARDVQADVIFDEVLDIADDGSNDWVEKRNSDGEITGWAENGEALRRSALRIDARKWIAGKLRPKKYGDKLQHTGADGEGPIETKDVTGYDCARRIAFVLNQASDKPA